jgi:hypothetical protein
LTFLRGVLHCVVHKKKQSWCQPRNLPRQVANPLWDRSLSSAPCAPIPGRAAQGLRRGGKSCLPLTRCGSLPLRALLLYPNAQLKANISFDAPTDRW